MIIPSNDLVSTESKLTYKSEILDRLRKRMRFLEIFLDLYTNYGQWTSFSIHASYFGSIHSKWIKKLRLGAMDRTDHTTRRSFEKPHETIIFMEG